MGAGVHTKQAESRAFSDRRAYALGMVESHRLMKALGLAGTFCVLVGYWFSLDSPLFTPFDTQIFLAIGVVYSICSGLLFVLSVRWLYTITLVWVGAAVAAVIGLALNSMFGPNSHQLFDDRLPSYLVFVPALIVFAYTYLSPRHATLLSTAYTLILTLSSVAFIALHWPEAGTSMGAIFLLLTFVILNPTVMGMMHLHRNLHLRATELIEAQEAKERLRRASLERARHTDIVTLTLNSEGVLSRVEQLLAKSTNENGPLQLFALMLDDAEPPTRRLLSTAKRGYVLQQMTALLRDTLGPGTEIGRLGGSHFLVWGYVGRTENRRAYAGKLLTRLRESEIGDKLSMSFSIGVATTRPGGSANFLIEDANFNLFLAQSRGGNQICDEAAVPVVSEKATQTA